VQILISPRSSDPLGHRRYWPIYAAAERANRPIALHVQGYSGGPASSPPRRASHYPEGQQALTGKPKSTRPKMVFEGVFERFPELRVVLVEGGFAWAPTLCWRMDKHWERLRKETPRAKRRPSEYVREHFWFTTQPIEEPDDPQHLADIIELVGW